MTAPVLERAARRIDWSYELLWLLLLTAESGLIYLGLLVLANGSLALATFPALPVIFAVLVTGSIVQRKVDAARLLSPHYEVVTGTALLTVLASAVWVISLPTFRPWDARWVLEAGRALALFPARTSYPVWLTVGLVAYGWWRGKQRDEPGLEAAHRMLRGGAAALLVGLIALTALAPSSEAHTWRAAFLTTTGFFGCVLSATALARIRLEEGRGVPRVTPRWLVAVVWPVVLLVAASTILSGLFTRSFFETLLWLLSPVFAVGRLLLLIALYVVTAFAYVVIAVFSWFLAQLGPIGPPAPAASPGAIATPNLDATDAVRTVPYADQVRLLAALAVIATVLWLLSRFSWRRRPSARASLEETRESVFSWSLLGDAATKLVQRLAPRRRRRFDPLDALRHDPRWQYTVVVRELYRAFLRHAKETRDDMAPGETPTDFARRLGASDPYITVPLRGLTTCYNAARYGGRPASASDAAHARRAWEELQRQHAKNSSPGRRHRTGTT